MSKFLLILELEESSELGLLSGLEVSHGNSLEVGHVSHFVFSMLSFFSGLDFSIFALSNSILLSLL